MATKKKANKAAGTKVISKVTRKAKPSSGKKTTISKGAIKPNATKGKKATTQKKTKAKPSKPATGKKTQAPSSSKKKTSTKKTTGSSGRGKKTQPASSSKNNTPAKKKVASSVRVKKKTPAVLKKEVTKKVAIPKGKPKKKAVKAKAPTTKKTVIKKSNAPVKTKSSSKGISQLSAQERYNVGGLCACVIETFTKDGQGRLKRVVAHLGLSRIEQANLVRVSQGLRIPKLFADGLPNEETRRAALKGLSQFARSDDPSGKRWKSDLEDFARLLGD